MTLTMTSQQQPTKEEAAEEADEGEEGRIQPPGEGLREEEVSTEYCLSHTFRPGSQMGNRIVFLSSEFK